MRTERLAIRGIVVGIVLLALLAGAPGLAAAQQDSDGDGVSDPNDDCPNQQGAKDNGCPVTVDICGTAFLPQLVSAIIQLSIYGGGIGLAVTYFGTSAMETLGMIGEDQRNSLKSARRRGLSAGIKILLVGPILTIVINAAGLPWADCINLVPFA